MTVGKKIEKKKEQKKKKKEKEEPENLIEKRKNVGKKEENEGQYEHFISMNFELGTDTCFFLSCFFFVCVLKLYYWKSCWSLRHEEEWYISLGK